MTSKEGKLLNFNFPQALKTMTNKERELLSYEIRDFLLENISETGGHLASNLGVVELSIALHSFFDSPKDRIIWDVGHQTYVHKILTGRADKFDTLRQLKGLSGFPKRMESPHDVADTGHSSTSIAIATGIAAARDLSGKDYSVVAVIGDGALTGGLAYEALNNAGNSKSNIIVILNDNGMSISQNTGGVAQHLSKLRTSKGYLGLKKQIKNTLKGSPGLYQGVERLKDTLKYALVDGAMFEELGFTYLPPVDGHNIEEMMEIFALAKRVEGPVLVHIITKKGKGYRNAEKNPNKFHGIGPFDKTTGMAKNASGGPSYSKVFGDKLTQMAAKSAEIVAVSAAMTDGTGLQEFAEKYPERFFDVGIAEEYAVSFASGLANAGKRPFVAIYSTFLQRAYDQIMIDVALNRMPVIFAIDRAGVVGEDGETHHGIFDISYLSHIPNLTILSPADGRELEEMMDYAITLDVPVAIRYPRGTAENIENKPDFRGNSYVMKAGRDADIWATGKMVKTALSVSERLASAGYDVGVVNAAVIKPFSQKILSESARSTGRIVTIEDNVFSGGMGEHINSLLTKLDEKTEVLNISWPDEFIRHGSVKMLQKEYGLDEDSIFERTRDFIERTTGCNSRK